MNFTCHAYIHSSLPFLFFFIFSTRPYVMKQKVLSLGAAILLLVTLLVWYVGYPTESNGQCLLISCEVF